MALADEIQTTLATNTGVLAAFGITSGSAPIYPVRPPAAAQFPFVVWNIVSSNPEEIHVGPAGLDSTLFQFATLAQDFTTGNAIRKAIRAALDGQKLSGGEPVTIIGERDLTQPTIDAYNLILEAHVMRDALAT